MQVNFVLSHWLPEEVPVVKNKIEKSMEVIENFATIGIDKTMNKINNLIFNSTIS
jgi:PTH1 family peptidyl-tRNA hydrolase